MGVRETRTSNKPRAIKSPQTALSTNEGPRPERGMVGVFVLCIQFACGRGKAPVKKSMASMERIGFISRVKRIRKTAQLNLQFLHHA